MILANITMLARPEQSQISMQYKYQQHHPDSSMRFSFFFSYTPVMLEFFDGPIRVCTVLSKVVLVCLQHLLDSRKTT